jgi:ATP-dependent DNA helicase RecG
MIEELQKLKVFVSSVQNELEDERLIAQNLLNTDPFLSAHCSPVLYEFEPASAERALDGCLKSLDGCQVYLLIIAGQYGTIVGDISITHKEYRRAKMKMLPILAFIKGDRKAECENGTEALVKELEADDWKYKRFGNVIDLQKEVRHALLNLLKSQFSIEPSSDENEIARQTIEATSRFESQRLTRLRWSDLDHGVARDLIRAAEGTSSEITSSSALLSKTMLRGLVWCDPRDGEHYATAAGIVLLARDPSTVFPRCRILADAYRGTEADGNPRDHEDIAGPMPVAINRATAFIDRNTRHPMRVIGLNRVRLEEYRMRH